jgi:hypothetical protein
MVDALVSKTSGVTPRAGSSPAFGTTPDLASSCPLFFVFFRPLSGFGFLVARGEGPEDVNDDDAQDRYEEADDEPPLHAAPFSSGNRTGPRSEDDRYDQ